MLSKPFLVFGSILLTLVGFAEYRGYSLNKVDELKDVPKSIRDNPGAYRSHYGFIPRYIGGK